jgi:type IV secretory pathway TraG/TraD family ATPase VirD4
MSPQLHGLTHGTNGLVLAYASILIPMLTGLIRGRAPLLTLVLSPVLAVPLILVAGIAMTLASPLVRSLGVARDGLLELSLGVAVSAVIGYAAGRLVARRRSSSTLYRRGAIVSNAEPAPAPRRSRRFRQNAGRVPDPNTPVTLAGIPVAAEDETKHFKFIGTTGTGKSTAIREMLSTALARGDRAVIADPDGGYLGHCYDASRGDVILNPFDPTSAKWNLLGEIKNDYDVDQLARSLIPDSGDADRIWSEYARTFFTAVTQQALAVRVNSDSRIYHLLTQATTQELKFLLSSTAAGPFLEDGNEKMFGSVRSVTSSAVRALKYTTRQQGTPFSVREWVRQGAARHAGGQGGVLFLPYKAGEIAALRSMISAWMRIAIFEVMDRGEGDQRLWFVVDELDALGEIDGLKDALARLRKFGGRTILGFQSIAQVSGTYGKGAADTIVENCGNTLILRCSASEHGGTSEFASKLIGQREVMHTTRSRTRRSSEWRASTTTSEHLKIEPAIMASEIERLPDLEGYLKFASIPDWRRVRLTPVSCPTVARSRPLETALSEPTPAPAAPPAASSAGAEPRSTPVRRAQSRAPTARGGRKPKAAATQANAPLGEVAQARHDSNRADREETETSAHSDGGVQNPGQGAQLLD